MRKTCKAISVGDPYGSSESINWYFLAAAASQAQDAQTEYNALINLAGIIINEEVGSPRANYKRLSGAGFHLGRAIQLAGYISFQQGQPYDNRMSYVMLVELGLYLPLDYSKDIQLNQYAQTLANIDAERNVKDELHLRVIGALSGAHLYFCIANANFFAQYGTINYLNEKRSRAVATINHAQWGLNELQQFYSGLGNVQLYQSLLYNYQQRAAAYNN